MGLFAISQAHGSSLSKNLKVLVSKGPKAGKGSLEYIENGNSISKQDFPCRIIFRKHKSQVLLIAGSKHIDPSFYVDFSTWAPTVFDTDYDLYRSRDEGYSKALCGNNQKYYDLREKAKITDKRLELYREFTCGRFFKIKSVETAVCEF